MNQCYFLEKGDRKEHSLPGCSSHMSFHIAEDSTHEHLPVLVKNADAIYGLCNWWHMLSILQDLESFGRQASEYAYRVIMIVLPKVGKPALCEWH